MNFIDRYKEHMEDQTTQDAEQDSAQLDMDTCDIPEEVLEYIREHSRPLEDVDIEKERELANQEMKELAHVCCDIADVFFERCKGKITNGKTVELIKSFYDIIGRVVE